jgi:hypothetical protein
VRLREKVPENTRRGVDVGSITLHPPRVPQRGLAEKSIGLHETHELAVMCDTFYPHRTFPDPRQW